MSSSRQAVDAKDRSAADLSLRELLSIGHLVRLGSVTLQLGLLILLVRVFQIENKAFLYLIVLAFFGFLVNHVLPLRHKLPFFAALSIAGILLIFGLGPGAWLIGIGCGLIGIAHLPLPYGLRVGLLSAVGCLLLVFRAGWWQSPFPGVIWPILAAMFMFRLLVYMYDLCHKAAPFGPARALAYFFMLPNTCFPLFPVVDYKKFCQAHYNDEPFRIYQTGLVYMLRGIFQLLIYRWIYQNLMLDSASVESAGAALQFMVSTYLLYLQVSGSFHLIVGMLHLFGFNLSETHHLFLLSSSFTDFWRRINIYWKDFILKLFFNPLYFKLSRKLGAKRAMVVATFYAFFFTWILHSYQTFWIRGQFPLTLPHAVFWTCLALAVLCNMLSEAKRPRRSNLKEPPRTLKSELRRALTTIATFCAICLGWSLWTTNSFEEFGKLVGSLVHITPTEALALAAGLGVLGMAAIVLGREARTQTEAAAARRGPLKAAEFWRSSVTVGGICGLALLVAKKPLLLDFEPQLVQIVSDLKASNRLNRGDAQMLERGYYEDITNVGNFSKELAALYSKRPADWGKNTAINRVGRENGVFPPYELFPGRKLQYKGATYTTNQWGMRDREYSKHKPPGTYRIAILGASHTGGSGVGDEETFENLVEDRLNAERIRGRYERFEILNFAVGGYGPLCRLHVLENKVFDFEPDAIIYVGINDVVWVGNEIAHAADIDIRMPYPKVVEASRAAGIEGQVPRLVAEQRIAPYCPELLGWAYEEIMALCEERGVKPYLTFLPRPEDRSREQADFDKQAELAAKAGFIMLDTSQAYSGLDDFASVWITPWDLHPDPRGHELLAEQLYSSLIGHLDPVD